MININLKSLVGKLNSHSKDALEAAAGLCMSRGQYNVEVEHWLIKLLEHNDSDLAVLLDKFTVDAGLLNKELVQQIDRFKTGSSRPPALSPSIIDTAKNAWVLASVEFGHPQLTSAHILCALLLDDNQRRDIEAYSKELRKIAPESLRELAKTIVGSSTESASLSQGDSDAGQNTPSAQPSSTPALDKYCINLTQRAKAGKIDPVLGRDKEIRQIIDILTRRRQNNPILTGEAGVGKTAVVEGFALRIAEDDVPTPLKGVQVQSLDLGLLQAGASVKGEFENRLKSVIAEVKASPVPIIMFIDEAHTLIGAGGKEGQGDAANLLKPALARGEMRTVAATTWAEYKKYFERDPALTRRFQVVKVEEPDESNAINMMRGIAATLEAHHGVRIMEAAIADAVRLSSRYISGRQLPDKAVSLLDTACARVALGQSTTPAAIEDCQRRIQQAQTSIAMLEKEQAANGDCAEALALCRDDLDSAQQQLDQLQAQWQQEKNLVTDIQQIRERLEKDYLAQQDASAAEDQLSDEQREQLKQELHNQTDKLAAIQGDHPLMQPNVEAQAVAEVVANWTGIPVGKMVKDEIQSVLNLRERMEQRVVGQSHALEAIAQSIRTARAGLTDPRKPIGVFMLVGPSGTGKTETALSLADLLYGGEHNITVINMSEFKEEHKVSMLVGSPPGYVGYGEGGVLTEAVRRKPYSVVLLDEMEKAHSGVQDVFYNLFDKGTIKDGEGRDIDFKNTVIIMTSNAGEQAIRQICASQEELPDAEVLFNSFRPELLKFFKPAFLGRSTVIPYYPLGDEVLYNIAKINLRRIEQRAQQHYGASLSYDEDCLLHIVARCQDVDTGARNIENILTRSLLPELAAECLSRLAEGETVEHIHIGVTEEGQFLYQINQTGEPSAELESEALAE